MAARLRVPGTPGTRAVVTLPVHPLGPHGQGLMVPHGIRDAPPVRSAAVAGREVMVRGGGACRAPHSPVSV